MTGYRTYKYKYRLDKSNTEILFMIDTGEMYLQFFDVYIPVDYICQLGAVSIVDTYIIISKIDMFIFDGYTEFLNIMSKGVDLI